MFLRYHSRCCPFRWMRAGCSGAGNFVSLFRRKMLVEFKRQVLNRNAKKKMLFSGFRERILKSQKLCEGLRKTMQLDYQIALQVKKKPCNKNYRMYKTKQLWNTEMLSFLRIMISSLLPKQDINKTTPKWYCSIRWWKYIEVERDKGREEGFGLQVLQVGKRQDLGYSRKRLSKGCAFWVEKTEKRSQFRPSLKSAG